MNKKIYKNNIVGILSELADKNYQIRTWANYNGEAGMTLSFVEAICMLFDDCVVGDYLQDGETLFDQRTTDAFHDLDVAVNAVDASDKNGEYRAQQEIINDPLMQNVREKAAKCLELIQSSNTKESTVQIID